MSNLRAVFRIEEIRLLSLFYGRVWKASFKPSPPLHLLKHFLNEDFLKIGILAKDHLRSFRCNLSGTQLVGRSGRDHAENIRSLLDLRLKNKFKLQIELESDLNDKQAQIELERDLNDKQARNFVKDVGSTLVELQEKGVWTQVSYRRKKGESYILVPISMEMLRKGAEAVVDMLCLQ
jgi:hypothetical protein